MAARDRSLQYTVPLYIGLGLMVLFAAWTWVSYRNVRDAALVVGEQRLEAVATQFATSYDSGARAYVRGLRTTAANPTIVAFVASGGTLMKDSLQGLLARSITGANRRVTFFALDGTPLMSIPQTPGDSSPAQSERHEELANVFAEVVKGPGFGAVAPMRIMNDSVVAPVVTVVLRDSQPVGFMVLWRRFTSNSTQTREQVSNIIGGDARLYLGNQRGDVWADVGGAISKFPIEMRHNGRALEYTDADNRHVLAGVRPIGGTPWAVVVEFDSKAVLAPATQFLQRSVVIGLIVLLVATLTASLLSRRLTKPLHELTAAATAVAGGDYSRSVTIRRDDELGQLSQAFNTMASSIAESRQALEEKVRERTAEIQERNEELEAYAHSIAHDLRAPLRAMHGFSQALIEDHSDQLDDAGKDYARRIVVAAQRMDLLTRDLLLYSRVSRGQLEVVSLDLASVTQGAIALLEADIGAQNARVTVQEPMLSAMGHPPLVEQAVNNLVANALKFMKPGVTPDVKIRSERRNGHVRLWVEDNGIGIDPIHHQRIFSVFERLHQNDQFAGTGIGLAIVRKAIERMGGSSGVESRIGEGSRFWIELRATSP